MDDARSAEIQAAWIDGVPRHDGPIHLAPYDTAWPTLFEREAARVRHVLGDALLSIEHVGSTAVPGLAAKPIIDILLVVPNAAEESSYVTALETAGYRLVIREPDWQEHRLLKGPDTNVNVHVFSAESGEIRRMLAFRDRLRSVAGERTTYEAAKRELAGRTWAYVQDYADAKSEVVEGIVKRAMADTGTARASRSWGGFAGEAPEFATFVRERLEAHRHRVMATLRVDGSPRLSGIELTIRGGELWIGGLPDSRKFDDLRRDPRLAVHSGSDDPPAFRGDARVSGIAVFVDDETARADFLAAAGGGPPGPFELVRVEINEVSAVEEAPTHDHLIISAWRPGTPVKRSERW